MGTETKVTDVRPAGDDCQVLTVIGGDKRYCTRPCMQCPFRAENDGSFPAEAFLHSAHTAYDMAGETFACHMAGKDKPSICAGFLLTCHHNMAVRMMAIRGDIEPDKVSDGGAKLHESYYEMAVANGVDEDDPTIRMCR